MHATIALCLMMVGGPVAPEPEITNIPLIYDQSTLNSIQDLEWKERVKHNPNLLPRISTIDDSQGNAGREARTWQRGGASGGMGMSDPYGQRRQPQQTAMPSAPTDPGELTGGRGNGMGPMPSVPGQGNQGIGQNYSPNRSTAFEPNSIEPNSFGQHPVNSGYGSFGGVLTQAPHAASTPSVANVVAGATAGAYQNYLNGLGANPMLDVSVGGGPKPFDSYQRPNGYSPWMSLYTTPTNNGTISTYNSSVQPQIQQQQFNSQVSEQIRGVQSMQNRMLYSGAGGVEQPVSGGAGSANPNAYINNMYMGPPVVH